MPDDPTAPEPEPTEPVDAAPLPLADLDRAHLALNTPASSAPGLAGKAVDRLLAGRDRRAAEATVAVGDGHNDIEMLAWAARGVAMGHADEPVRAVADEVTGTIDDDGAVAVLRSLLR